MSTLKTALLQCRIPLLESRRFRGKINIQRPRKPHFERQLLIDISKPFYGPLKSKLPDIDLCNKGENKWKKLEIDNPFERILANECFAWFNKSKMVVFLHVNSITMQDKLPLFATLTRNNMHLRKYNRKIMRMATSGTRFEAVNHLFTSHQDVIFGQPENAKKLFTILKKVPQMIVMAGIIEDRLLSKNELVEFSQLPDLQMARSQLCTILHSAGTTLVSELNQAQQLIVSHLDRHAQTDSEVIEKHEHVET